ncbi:MAG: right-handed parallel beta-helix repeat-containing protein [Desulfobacteraceae bacterium]|nr:right-handed parallel beta-helix repeat-containing protein [Desulfobacteraceae bacterium]
MQAQRIVKLFKNLFFLNTFFLLIIFSASNTFADFYVIAGSRGVGTKINSLPYIIESSGFYFIDKDLSCTATNKHGITITADHVTLDLMGFSLIGPNVIGAYNGIYMNVRTNVEIRNGTIRNFSSWGIYEEYPFGDGHRVINVRAKGNQSGGIGLRGYNNLVKGCTSVKNGGDGINAGMGSTATGNTCYGNDHCGIVVSYGSTVTGNTCYDNDTYGIYASFGSTITGNTCYKNTTNGIWTGGWGCSIIGNTCYNNTNYGIYANHGSNVINNCCCGNSTYGIYLAGNNLASQNTCYSNTTANIYDGGDCTIINNHAPDVP